jgi:hypothetical protein
VANPAHHLPPEQLGDPTVHELLLFRFRRLPGLEPRQQEFPGLRLADAVQVDRVVRAIAARVCVRTQPMQRRKKNSAQRDRFLSGACAKVHVHGHVKVKVNAGRLARHGFAPSATRKCAW